MKTISRCFLEMPETIIMPSQIKKMMMAEPKSGLAVSTQGLRVLAQQQHLHPNTVWINPGDSKKGI